MRPSCSAALIATKGFYKLQSWYVHGLKLISWKIERLKQLVVFNGKAQNESISDTFMDLANYSIIAEMVSKKIWGK